MTTFKINTQICKLHLVNQQQKSKRGYLQLLEEIAPTKLFTVRQGTFAVVKQLLLIDITR